MEEVPLKTIKCGRMFTSSETQHHCFLSCQKPSPILEFVWRCSSNNDGQSVSFQCGDISAVDLRVETKFGSIDAMIGRIIVECLSPVLVQNVNLNNMEGNDPYNVKISGTKSFIIEATFHVKETGAVRDIIRQLRSSSEDRNTKKNEHEVPRTKVAFKEGLPDWVVFIPHYLYSRRARNTIELGIFLYMIFSVTWALWQLYRHVDFVREFVTPFIELLQYQYQVLDYVVHLFNTIFEEYTIQWLCFIKPLYTVGTTLATPLCNILGQLSPILYIILQSLTSVLQVLKPVANPILSIGYQFVELIGTIFCSLKILAGRLWSPFYNISVPAMVTIQFQSVKRIIGFMYYGSLHQARHLDRPLKAQLSVMRTTVINSSKAVGLGIGHLMRQIYKIIWLRRSAKIHKKE